MPALKNFQQTLIYSGKIGTKKVQDIEILRRIFLRPANGNNPVYGIVDFNDISYKGALIENIDSNNIFIKYRVLEKFTKICDC